MGLWNWLKTGQWDEPLPPMEWTSIFNDPDADERYQLQLENERLKKRHELLKLAEENASLRKECKHLEASRAERERREAHHEN